MTGTWRNNILLRSADNVLSDGLYVPDGIIHDPGAYSGSPMTYQNFSREIIGKYPYSTATQVTIIPTGGHLGAGRRRERCNPAVHPLHVHQVLGFAGKLDHELLGHQLLR